MSKNLYAYTAMGLQYPEYISVNETDDPNLFTITIRSKPNSVREYDGPTAEITLTMVQMNELAGAILRGITGDSV